MCDACWETWSNNLWREAVRYEPENTREVCDGCTCPLTEETGLNCVVVDQGALILCDRCEGEHFARITQSPEFAKEMDGGT
jgi:hypothetical protein